jgi:S1-C subfamily serine protease
MKRIALTSLLIFVALAAAPALAQPLPSLETAASRLQAATATVRLASGVDEAAAPQGDEAPAAEKDANAPTRVSIYSGVLLPGGLAVTHVDAAVRARFRLTLAGGERIESRLAVLDEYSGLALLECEGERLPSLPLAEATPKAGAWILSAAGWGAEAPAVSLGVVGAEERVLPGGRFPPVIQCDLQSASTSRGAGVVNQQGELVGVVVAVENVEGRRGWTYAVPVQHVRRLLRAREERKQGESVVVLKRRRPVVGMTLAGAADDAERVFVERVTEAGPAAEAGLRPGDRIIAADGLNLRSVYEAQRAVLQKQPGDKIAFHVQRDGVERKVEVVLGGGVELPAPPADQNIAEWIRPQLEIEGLGQGRYRSQGAGGEVREVLSPPAAEGESDEELRPRTPSEEIALLQKALDRYRQAIVYLKSELSHRETERRAAEQKLEELQKEIEALERRLK